MLLLAAMATWVSVLPAQQPALEPLVCLARVYLEVGRPHDSDRLFQQALATALVGIGPEHPLTGAVKVEYARALRVLGLRADSAAMEREGKAIMERSSPLEEGRYKVDVSELLSTWRRR